MLRWLTIIPIFIIIIFTGIYFTQPTPTNTLSPVVSKIIPTIVPTPTSIPAVTVGLAGDLGLGRHITSTARSKKDFSWSFTEISPWLLENNFNLANLESPIIKDCPTGVTGTFTFCGDDRFIPQLFSNNFVLNLNNNHILNYGADGLRQTQSLLPDISFFDKPLIKENNGITFGFLGYDFITYPKTNTQDILNAIANLRPQVDFVVVSIHWGNEYLPRPEPWRIDLAHKMIDAGADVIHGHHPHVWQGVEAYQKGIIFYSFGNFIFDQSWSYETSHSKIAKVKFKKGEPLQYDLFPIEIRSNSQPRLMP